MEYNLKIKEENIVLDMALKNRKEFKAGIKDSCFKVRCERVSDNQLHLCVNGQNINAWVGREKNGKTIVLGGQRYFIQDNDLLAQTQTRKTEGLDGPAQVTPPMPAVVILVPVKLGDRVEKGDKVVVISAMKMETCLTAPHGGTITRVGVAQGDKVMPGDILVDIRELDEKPSNQEE